MLKTLSFCGLLLVMATGLASADVYMCKKADGSIIFTDNQANIPPECQMDVVRDLPPNGISSYSPPSPVKQRTATQRLVSTSEPEQREAIEDVHSFLKKRAESLANQFVSTRKRVFRSTKVKNKQTARRELTEIRARKSSLLSEVAKSPLNRAQKKEVREILEFR